MDQQLIQQLGKRLNLTDLNLPPEPYVLTDEEEKSAISHAIGQAQRQKTWKLSEMGFKEESILANIAKTNWEEEIDISAVLKQANSNKNYDLWQDEQRKKDAEAEKQKQIEIQQRCTASHIYRMMAWVSKNQLGKPLIVNEHTLPLIKTICFFISNDERFETELGFSFNKGLLIRGISGIGKTHVVKCIEKNELNPVLILSMIEISEELKENGVFEIIKGNKKIIYLDDVGTEEPSINHFGTKITFFKNFIETYYLRNKAFNRLIISTNENWKGVEEKYGFRVRSRMQEMFNVINVTGSDMRK